MTMSARISRARSVTVPVRIHRSWARPNGALIRCHTTRPAGHAPPDLVATWTSCPRSARPCATDCTWTDPPSEPGTVWSMARYRMRISALVCRKLLPRHRLAQQREVRARSHAAKEPDVHRHDAGDGHEDTIEHPALPHARLRRGTRGLHVCPIVFCRRGDA